MINKVTVESNGVTVVATQVTPEGLAQIIDIIFKSSEPDYAAKFRGIRLKFRLGEFDKVEAIKAMRNLVPGHPLVECSLFLEEKV